MPIIVYVHIHLGIGYFMARSVNLNHIWDRVLLNTPGLKIANPQMYAHIHNNRYNQPMDIHS